MYNTPNPKPPSPSSHFDPLSILRTIRTKSGNANNTSSAGLGNLSNITTMDSMWLDQGLSMSMDMNHNGHSHQPKAKASTKAKPKNNHSKGPSAPNSNATSVSRLTALLSTRQELPLGVASDVSAYVAKLEAALSESERHALAEKKEVERLRNSLEELRKTTADERKSKDASIAELRMRLATALKKNRELMQDLTETEELATTKIGGVHSKPHNLLAKKMQQKGDRSWDAERKRHSTQIQGPWGVHGVAHAKPTTTSMKQPSKKPSVPRLSAVARGVARKASPEPFDDDGPNVVNVDLNGDDESNNERNNIEIKSAVWNTASDFAFTQSGVAVFNVDLEL